MKKWWIGIFIGCLFAAGTAHASEAEGIEKIADDGKEWETLVVGEFSADVILTSSQGRFSYRFYAGAERSRMEMGDHVSIVRLDRGLTYVLIPAQNSFIEQPLTSEAAAQAAGSEGSILSRKELDRETLNGKDAVKYEVVLSAAGNRQTVYQWMSSDSPVPLRMQAVDGSWSVEYLNVVVGPQPAALFEVPGGFQRMEMGALPQDASEVAAFQEAGEKKLKEDLKKKERGKKG